MGVVEAEGGGDANGEAHHPRQAALQAPLLPLRAPVLVTSPGLVRLEEAEWDKPEEEMGV